MFKRFVAIVVLFALISSGFSRFVVFAAYEVNQKFIADNLCENRSRPLMHCNGKCYLMKKIKATEEKEKKQEKENQKNSYQEASQAFFVRIALAAPLVVHLKYPISATPLIVNRSYSIFQPPKIA